MNITLHIQKETNTVKDHHLPSDWTRTDFFFFNVRKRKKAKKVRVLNTRCPDENNHRWVKQTIRTSGTRDILWENTVQK